MNEYQLKVMYQERENEENEEGEGVIKIKIRDQIS